MATLTSIKGKRHESYAKRVAAFIATNGPEFTLAQVTHSDVEFKCECCGYNPIVNLFHVVSKQTGNRFIVGSECQELVLGFGEAHMPAARVRMLDASQLNVLGAKYGLTATEMASLNAAELASAVIKCRRKAANIQGWVERRRLGKVPAKTAAVATE